jgi:hypothetical protein
MTTDIPKLRDLVYSKDPDDIVLNLIVEHIANMGEDATTLEIQDNKQALKRHKKDCAALVEFSRLYERKIKEEVQSEVLGPKTVGKGAARGRVDNILEYNKKRAADKLAAIEEAKLNQ